MKSSLANLEMLWNFFTAFDQTPCNKYCIDINIGNVVGRRLVYAKLFLSIFCFMATPVLGKFDIGHGSMFGPSVCYFVNIQGFRFSMHIYGIN